MDANILHSSSYPKPYFLLKRPAFKTQTLLCPAPFRLCTPHATSPATSSSSSSENKDEESKDNSPATTTPPRLPPNTLNIRYRARSKRQARQQQQDIKNTNLSPPPPPKDWEEMTLGEKAVELYVGEKGLLFWLNKFAYASIFIIIGGWILFRFVGPSLGLYQLDAPPLSPSNVLKG